MVFAYELVSIRNRTSERSERVRFLTQINECVNTIQRHIPCCIVFIICMLRFKQQSPRLVLVNSNCLSLMILTGY